ncbi:hypothetical protein F7725_002660 [Dissostichus mawsoni]|uniref:Uncharacterized protein n=1 Tax=Dissostichus mawsoni TaxID=36200 RepID=A0A7J5Y436_DISMA|nr:hypothetical protein F7725_002660 [Dissostichus mawsoni]
MDQDGSLSVKETLDQDGSLSVKETLGPGPESLSQRDPGPGPESLSQRDPGPGPESLSQRPWTRTWSRIQISCEPEPGSEESKDVVPGSRSEKTNISESESESEPDQTRDLQPGPLSDQTVGSRSDVKPEDRSEETRDLQPGPLSDQTVGSRSDVKPEDRSEETRDLQPGPLSDQTVGSRSDVKPEDRSEETRDLQTGLKLNLNSESRSTETKDLESGSRSHLNPDFRSDLKTVFRSEETRDLQTRSTSELGSRSTSDQQLGSGSDVETESSSEEDPDLQLGSGSELESEPDQIQSLNPVPRKPGLGVWIRIRVRFRSESELANQQTELQGMLGKETEEDPAHQDLPTNQRLRLLSSCEELADTVSLLLVFVILRLMSASGLQQGSRSAGLDAENMKQILDQINALQPGGSPLSPLKTLTRTRTRTSTRDPPSPNSLLCGSGPERAAGSEQEVRLKPGAAATLHHFPPHGTAVKNRKQFDSGWEKTPQSFLSCQELGNSFLQTANTKHMCLSGVWISVEPAVGGSGDAGETRHNRTGSERDERVRIIQIQEQRDYCRKYRERLDKTLQDLNCVSEMLDSCTLMDLGSDLQTSKLLERFSQARPHFTQLDAEVEFMLKSWETLRGVQKGLEEEEDEEEEGPVEEEDLSELLKLQEKVKKKIRQSESILDRTSSFHLTSRQLEVLIQTLTGSCGSSEEQQQIQSLFKTASTLKSDICTSVSSTGWTSFHVDQLEARLFSLDSLCVSWLKEASRREEKLRRERLLNDDINQLRETFKELKKRFSNLRKRLGGATSRLGSEVRDGGFARETEDAVNELQRQMGELERSVGEHQKTLEMTCRLQTAMEECRSTEAVSVLHRQFEKFVWPTVPQQEERISQITELAVRLHGVEEGRRYIEKTVSKHSEMVESIRALSDGLLALEAKLRMESLKNQQDDGQKEEEEEEDKEKDEDEEKKRNNRRSQEASDMHELKETGHTPELTAEHDGKEVPVKRQIAAKRKPPLQKSCSLDAERQTESRVTSSYCSTHTFSFPCSPLDTNRRVHNIHNQSQPAATEATPSPSVTGPSFSDIQREFGKDASRGSLSEAELHDVMMEDSLSNDEYDCASPDDISLPPLAETPESIMVQSDVEEGYCFSSHSVHTNQYSRQSERSGTSTGSGSGTGAVRQHRQSSRTDSCPTPPTSRHSSSRFRSESSSFVQSPLTVPAPILFTSTLCSILKTKKTSTANVCLGGLNRASPQYPTHSTRKDNEVPDKRSPSKTEPVLKEHVSQYNQPQRRTGSPSMITQTDGTLLQTDPQVAELNHIPAKLPQSSCIPEAFNGPDPDCHKDKTPSQETRFLKINTTFPQIKTLICQKNRLLQSFPDTVDAVSKQQRDSFISSPFGEPSDIHCTLTQSSSNLRPKQEQFKTLPEIGPGKAFALSPIMPTLHKNTGLLKSCEICLKTKITLPENSNLSVSSLDSGSGLDQGCTFLPNQQRRILHNHTLKQSSSNLRSQQEQFKTLPVIDPDTEFAHSSSLPLLHQDRIQDTGILTSCKTGLQTNTTLPQNSNLSISSLDSGSGLDQDVPSSQTSKEALSDSMPQSSKTVKDTVYCQPSPSNSHCTLTQVSSKFRSQRESTLSQGGSGVPEVHASNIPEPNSISNIFSNKHQTVYSLHEPLTSSCTQQCVHDPGITPAAPPLPQPEPQALAHLHVTPLSSPPHLLMPDQDPTICQPMTIREEIRLTPQIQGPSLPAPVPQAQAESLPQGKASHPGPPCFTRPLSRATVMEGSPVTLEVEVMALPEPTLTVVSCFPFSGFKSQTCCVSNKPSGLSNIVSSSGDSWLVSEVFDVLAVDWQSWLGTLCVLLWLLYLILL